MNIGLRIQSLRKRRGMSQEELAEKLYVSRTAVSKWESGRGYPNLDSLKALSKFFSVTVDELLSEDETHILPDVTDEQRKKKICTFVFGLIDLSVVLLLFLPLFGCSLDGNLYETSLLSLVGTAPYLRITYFAVVMAISAYGALTLLLQSRGRIFREGADKKISLLLNAVGTLVFIASPQPYAAALLFGFLSVKIMLLRQ